MIVSELISFLKAMDQNMPVVANDGAGGYGNVTESGIQVKSGDEMYEEYSEAVHINGW